MLSFEYLVQPNVLVDVFRYTVLASWTLNADMPLIPCCFTTGVQPAHTVTTSNIQFLTTFIPTP